MPNRALALLPPGQGQSNLRTGLPGNQQPDLPRVSRSVQAVLRLTLSHAHGPLTSGGSGLVAVVRKRWGRRPVARQPRENERNHRTQPTTGFWARGRNK